MITITKNPYAGIFRMRLVAGTQYRAAAWAGVATQFFWGGIQLLVFRAFYAGGADAPMSFGQLADFIWLRQAFLALVMLWAMDNDLLELICRGGVAYELCRPLSLYRFWFARVLAYRLARTLLRCAPILIITGFLPEPWRFHPPASVTAGLAFAASLTLAALLVTALSMFSCLIAFATLSQYAARLSLSVFTDFFMGVVIPLPFMPPALERLASALPFRYMADFPFRVYSGHIAGHAALTGLAWQAAWLAGLTALGALGFRRALRRVVIQGG